MYKLYQKFLKNTSVQIAQNSGFDFLKICANFHLTKSAAGGIMENSRQVERLPRDIIT
jgi:hypothetical protein